MSNETAASCDILIKNVPGDIVQELGRRAEAHFRSRSGEIMAILAAVTRGRVEPPVSLYPGVVTASGDDQDKPAEGETESEIAEETAQATGGVDQAKREGRI